MRSILSYSKSGVRPGARMLLLLSLVLLAGGAGAAVELRDAELVAGGRHVLASRGVRLEDARLGRVGPPVFVPEPGALLQLGGGIGFLMLLAEHRRRRRR